jgi:hypothetical protein
VARPSCSHPPSSCSTASPPAHTNRERLRQAHRSASLIRYDPSAGLTATSGWDRQSHGLSASAGLHTTAATASHRPRIDEHVEADRADGLDSAVAIARPSEQCAHLGWPDVRVGAHAPEHEKPRRGVQRSTTTPPLERCRRGAWYSPDPHRPASTRRSCSRARACALATAQMDEKEVALTLV